jgi:hypothetical protein
MKLARYHDAGAAHWGVVDADGGAIRRIGAGVHGVGPGRHR